MIAKILRKHIFWYAGLASIDFIRLLNTWSRVNSCEFLMTLYMTSGESIGELIVLELWWKYNNSVVSSVLEEIEECWQLRANSCSVISIQITFVNREPFGCICWGQHSTAYCGYKAQTNVWIFNHVKWDAKFWHLKWDAKTKHIFGILMERVTSLKPFGAPQAPPKNLGRRRHPKLFFIFFFHRRRRWRLPKWAPQAS